MSTFDSARRFLRRVFVSDLDSELDGPPEPAPALPATPGTSEEAVDSEFMDLLDELGAEPSSGEPIDLRDTELEELRTILVQLQPLGEELARTEQERARLETRCVELEQALADQASALETMALAKEPDASRREARLMKLLEEREGVLERERERSAQARRQRDDRNRVAADRWRDLQTLKARLRASESSAKQDA